MNSEHTLHRVAECEIARLEAITQRRVGLLRPMVVLHLEHALKRVFDAGVSVARVRTNGSEHPA